MVTTNPKGMYGLIQGLSLIHISMYIIKVDTSHEALKIILFFFVQNIVSFYNIYL